MPAENCENTWDYRDSFFHCQQFPNVNRAKTEIVGVFWNVELV